VELDLSKKNSGLRKFRHDLSIVATVINLVGQRLCKWGSPSRGSICDSWYLLHRVIAHTWRNLAVISVIIQLVKSKTAAIFTARCYASAVLAMGLCLSVSVTSRSSTKTVKPRITQTKPHDSPGTLVFWCQRYPRNSTGVGAKCRWVGQNRRLSTITGYISKTVRDRRMVSSKVQLEVVCTLSNDDIAADPEWPLTAPNHPIFCILHRHSYLRNGWTKRRQIWYNETSSLKGAWSGSREQFLLHYGLRKFHHSKSSV